ncbi:MAG: hypothetical protein U5P10_05885 [Spirochaetia bacterium]|nr:hypothetical protein [Spirochaetia bacterium]
MLEIIWVNPSEYLQNGRDTQITDEQWKRIGPQIKKGDFREVLRSVYDWKDQAFSKESRKRGQIEIPNASSLIEKRTLYGCHDDGAVMAAVMRRSGYPVVMVETVSIQWAREYK